ncbi:MAG: hypothetical protein LUC88_02725 [Prevotella sp.]|nr:hypothetical protein [Prevotella sp.]
MKKFLLGAFALFTAVAVNAQNFEVGHADELNLSSDAQELTEETAVHTGTNVVWYLGVGKWTKSGAGTTVTVTDTEGNSESVGFSTGATSDANPTVDGTNVDGKTTSLPNAGTYVKFEVKKDGYLYVLGKYSVAKVFVVWEGEQRIPYYFAAADETSQAVISFDLKDYATLNDDGSIDDSYEILKPDQYMTVGNDGNDAACVVKFPVSADKTYTFCGAGTKASISAYCFAESENEITITYGDYTLISPDSTSGEDNNEDGNKDDNSGSNEEGGTTDNNSSATYECYFDTKSSQAGNNNSIFTCTQGSSSSYSEGSLTYEGNEYTHYFKLETGSTIEIAVPNDNMTLTIVFGADANNHNVYVDEQDNDHNLVGEAVGDDTDNPDYYVATYTFASAGTHTLYTHQSSRVYYMKLVGTTGINGVSLQATGNNIYYNLNGQRVSNPAKGVYILNGKKVLVK